MGAYRLYSNAPRTRSAARGIRAETSVNWI